MNDSNTALEVMGSALEYVIAVLKSQNWRPEFKAKVPEITEKLRTISLSIARIDRPNTKAMLIVDKRICPSPCIVLGEHVFNMFKPEYLKEELFWIFVHEYLHAIIYFYFNDKKPREKLFEALAIVFGIPPRRRLHGGQVNLLEKDRLR